MHSVDYPHIGRGNKIEELGKKKKKQQKQTQSRLNIYKALLHFNCKQFFRSAGTFQLC